MIFFFYSVSMVDYSNVKIKMHVAIAEKLQDWKWSGCNFKVKMCDFLGGWPGVLIYEIHSYCFLYFLLPVFTYFLKKKFYRTVLPFDVLHHIILAQLVFSSICQNRFLPFFFPVFKFEFFAVIFIFLSLYISLNSSLRRFLLVLELPTIYHPH